ncbi:hypothetical protein [Pseudonocardia acaciae]|uniref:hypothetical protein n=1 Tax=Pseudonocardia acaciae TaxID=551276 RepID=UPI0012EE63F1|nr:hypothetical protein [Pseudonocardia acaciae]
MFHQSVVVLRAPLVTDKYRNRTPDWARATRTPIAGVSVQPAGRAEVHEPGQRDRVASGWTLQTPPRVDLDLLPTDRVELDNGQVCEVVGEVARHPDPFGRGVHHIEVHLERVTG